MATLAAGNFKEIHFSSSGVITVAPGVGGFVRFDCSSPNSDVRPTGRRIYKMTPISIPAGSAVTLEAFLAPAQYNVSDSAPTNKNAPTRRLINFGTWGDSRANPSGNSTSNSFEDYAVVGTRPPAFLALFGGNVKLTFNGGFGGDGIASWSSAARSGGKTLSALAAANLDGLYYHLGINTINAYSGGSTSTYAATVYAALKRNIAAIAGMVNRVYVESVNPANTAAASMASLPAEKEAIRRMVNTELASFCASLPNVRFLNTDPLLLDASTGYLGTQFSDDGLHLNNYGAFEVNRQYLQPAVELDFPPPRDLLYLPSTIGPNLVDSLYSASASGQSADFYAQSFSGSNTIGGYEIGRDDYGLYQAWTVTPTALSSGYASAAGQMHARVAGGSPLFSVVAAEKYAAGCRLMIDDGAGGAPNCNGLIVRLRTRYSAASAKTSQFTALCDTTEVRRPSRVTGPLYVPWCQVPGSTLNGGSADMEVADAVNPSRGMCIEVVTWADTINVPYRVKLYAPAIARVS